MILFVSQVVEQEALEFARNKSMEENRGREAIRNGMLATEASAQFGVL